MLVWLLDSGEKQRFSRCFWEKTGQLTDFFLLLVAWKIWVPQLKEKRKKTEAVSEKGLQTPDNRIKQI